MLMWHPTILPMAKPPTAAPALLFNRNWINSSNYWRKSNNVTGNHNRISKICRSRPIPGGFFFYRYDPIALEIILETDWLENEGIVPQRNQAGHHRRWPAH